MKRKFENLSGDFYIVKSKYNEDRTNIHIKDNGQWVTASLDDLEIGDLYEIRELITKRIIEIKENM